MVFVPFRRDNIKNNLHCAIEVQMPAPQTKAKTEYDQEIPQPHTNRHNASERQL